MLVGLPGHAKQFKLSLSEARPVSPPKQKKIIVLTRCCSSWLLRPLSFFSCISESQLASPPTPELCKQQSLPGNVCNAAKAAKQEWVWAPVSNFLCFPILQNQGATKEVKEALRNTLIEMSEMVENEKPDRSQERIVGDLSACIDVSAYALDCPLLRELGEKARKRIQDWSEQLQTSELVLLVTDFTSSTNDKNPVEQFKNLKEGWAKVDTKLLGPQNADSVKSLLKELRARMTKTFLSAAQATKEHTEQMPEDVGNVVSLLDMAKLINQAGARETSQKCASSSPCSVGVSEKM